MKYVKLKFLFLTFVSLTFSINASAQHKLSWVNTYGALSGNDLGTYANDLAILGDTVYIVGGYTGPQDFDPGDTVDNHSMRGVGDAFVQKLNLKTGAVYWTRTIGSSAADIANHVAVDGLGNVYFAGTYEGSIDLDPTEGVDNKTNASGKDIFLVKLNSKGDYVWGKNWSASLSEYASCIITDDNQNVYLAGRTDQNIDLDPNAGTVNFNQNSSTYEAGFIVKLDADGNYQWHYQIHGEDHDQSVYTDVTFDPTGNLIFTGIASGETNFDFQNKTAAYNDVTNNFILKISLDGQYIQSDVFSGPSTSKVYVDSNGDTYLSGGRIAERDPHDFDHGSGVYVADKDNGNAYLLKLNSNWEFQWMRQLGPNTPSCRSIKATPNGDIVAAFYMNSYLEVNSGDERIFGPKDFPGQNNFAVLIISFSPDGEFQWYRNLENPDDHFLGNLEINGNGDFLLCGSFEETQNFNPVNGGENYISETLDREDAYVTRWEPCIPKDTSIEMTTCEGDSVLSPGGDIYYKKQGTYTDTIPTKDGCDSIITIQFYFQKYFHLIREIQCEPYIHHSGKVFYSDTIFEEGPYTSSYGCDSVARYAITIRGDYFFDTLEVCNSYTAPNGDEITESGDYEFTFQNGFNCDSTYFINLSIFKDQVGTSAVKVCQEYLGPDGNTYNESGTLNFNLQTVNGCDSLAIVDLEVIGAINKAISRAGNTLTADQEFAEYQWVDCQNDMEIPGANQRSFTPTQNGRYKVIIDLQDCSVESECSDFTVGISEFEVSRNFKMFPNPSDGIVHTNVTGDYAVMDIHGRLILKLEQVNTLNLQKLPSGVYLIQLNEGTPQKLVKK